MVHDVAPSTPTATRGDEDVAKLYAVMKGFGMLTGEVDVGEIAWRLEVDESDMRRVIAWGKSRGKLMSVYKNLC